MRKILLALAVVAFALVATVRAQTTLYDYNYPLIGMLEIPSSTGSNVSQGSLYFGGWALDCVAADLPQYVTLYRYDNGLVNVPITVYPITRTDVQSVYSPYCSGLGSSLGYQIYPTNTEPTGYWQYFIVFSNANHDTITLAQEVNVTF